MSKQNMESQDTGAGMQDTQKQDTQKQETQKQDTSTTQDQIALFKVTPLETNCYAYISGNECMVVDPGAHGTEIAQSMPTGVRVTRIVATHGHGDHVGGVYDLKMATDATFYIHAADEELSRHAGEASELGRTYDHNAPAADEYLHEGMVITFGTAAFRVIEAPGHTPGGCVLLGEGSAQGLAFVGDTLFAGSCGRTDLAGGDPQVMRATLARLKEVIPASTTLLCGHGDICIMEDELKTNPCLK